MAREILFKGKRKDNGEWIEGYLLKYSPTFEELSYILLLHQVCVLDIEVYPETVCQYTGLTDKNGRKIFEGDIFREESSFEEEPFIHTIVYSEEHKTFTTDIQICGSLDEPLSEYLDFNKCEVIGNIFEGEQP